jgi:hypothetical protein
MQELQRRCRSNFSKRRKVKIMQTLLEAASHIAQEIERTRQHLTNLEHALQGLRPLITIDADTTALSFTATPPAQAVEDASIVSADVTAGKVVKPKPVAKPKSKQKSEQKVKSAKAETGVIKPVQPKVEAKPVSKTLASNKSTARTNAQPAKTIAVPSTGAELWLSCLGRKKLSTTELIDEALKKLDLDANSRFVIANRARTWLNASVKSGLVIAAGTRDGTNLYKRAVTQVG